MLCFNGLCDTMENIIIETLGSFTDVTQIVLLLFVGVLYMQWKSERKSNMELTSQIISIIKHSNTRNKCFMEAIDGLRNAINILNERVK